MLKHMSADVFDAKTCVTSNRPFGCALEDAFFNTEDLWMCANGTRRIVVVSFGDVFDGLFRRLFGPSWSRLSLIEKSFNCKSTLTHESFPRQTATKFVQFVVQAARNSDGNPRHVVILSGVEVITPYRQVHSPREKANLPYCARS